MKPSISAMFSMAWMVFCISACQSPVKQESSQLGEINFEASGSDQAQPAFKKGMLLLHSFEYVDAAEAFRETQKLDPEFIMAYWGEAMTKNHPLWQEQDYDQGNLILSKISPDPEERVNKAKTEMEKDFVRGINILYGKGNKAERDSSYAVFMESLYQKYPGNDEIASFYSLALNGWGTTEQAISILEKAAAIGNEVLKRNPRHPGALHYVIHALDNPQHAAQALATADKYAKVAPAAGHALHMPTHTYLALGLWDKVVSSNEVSWAAERARKQRKQLDNDALGYHSWHWLQYGYLQLGNKAKARAMVDSVRLYVTEKPSPRARAHMLFVKTTYLAETNDYSKEVVDISVPQNDLNIVARSKNYFALGMNAYFKKDKAAMDQLILQLAGERLVEEAKTAGKGIRLCGNINRSLPTKNDLLESEAMELQLKAMRAWLDQDAASTEKMLKRATALQDQAGYSYGPPSIVKPTYEMFGEWLLENNRAKEALDQFEQSLKMAPNRLLSKLGKQKAQEHLKTGPLARL